MTPPYSFETFKDNNIFTTTSLENLGGHFHDHHQSLLFDDIDQYLSEVTLPQPEPEYHHLDDPYTIEYDLFQEGCDPTPIHTLPHEGAEIKNVADQAIDDSRGKQLIPAEPERRDGHHHLQDSFKKRTQKRSSGNKRRRERINANIKAIQQLIPPCGKGNHAIILERAIEYIKSLKLHIHAISKLRSEQGQFQAPYAAQMMTQPWPPWNWIRTMALGASSNQSNRISNTWTRRFWWWCSNPTDVSLSGSIRTNVVPSTMLNYSYHVTTYTRSIALCASSIAIHAHPLLLIKRLTHQKVVDGTFSLLN